MVKLRVFYWFELRVIPPFRYDGKAYVGADWSAKKCSEKVCECGQCYRYLLTCMGVGGQSVYLPFNVCILHCSSAFRYAVTV